MLYAILVLGVALVAYALIAGKRKKVPIETPYIFPTTQSDLNQRTQQ